MNVLGWIVLAPTVAAASYATTALLWTTLHRFAWPDIRPVAQRALAQPQVRDALLRRARSAIRAGELELAEALVMEYGDLALSDAACLNVLGVIAEVRGKWSDARKFWSRALRADPRSDAAYQNLRRYFELWNWGRSECQRAFGDETTLDLLRARSLHRGH
jgi:tetratricopeptide (TPR) repeat protein